MAFVADDRVLVSAENSQFRGKLGVVDSVDGDGNRVRLDGQHAAGQTTLFRDEELRTSTQPVPIDYP